VSTNTKGLSLIILYVIFKSLFLMPVVVYTICYLLHVQILYTDLDSIYHTFANT